MIVASAGHSQRIAAAPAWLVAGRAVRRDRHDALEHSADQR